MRDASPWTLTARWIFPVSRPPLERGTITIQGASIVAVEPHGSRPADVDLSDAAIVPGFVNAHTHLDLSGLRGLAPPTSDFTAWLRQVIAHRRGRKPEQVQADILAGLAESMRFGTTLVGDISGDGGSWEALSEASIQAVIFREMLGLTPERAAKAWEDSDVWLAAHHATATCRPGISPHAPYSVRSSLFLAASTSGCPTAIHLSETAEENELLGHYRGPFVRFLQDLGVWAPDGLAEDADHVLRLFNGLSPALFIHCNYLRPDVPIPPNGSIIYCPRTHAAFGHAPHPFREFLARGVRVALGTDSLASNPDLDLFAEARFLRQCHPDVTGDTLLRMATLNGAEALGWGNETGSLDAGKSADLVALTIPNKPTNDPHNLILDDPTAVQRVLFRGQWRDGTS